MQTCINFLHGYTSSGITEWYQTASILKSNLTYISTSMATKEREASEKIRNVAHKACSINGFVKHMLEWQKLASRQNCDYSTWLHYAA